MNDKGVQDMAGTRFIVAGSLFDGSGGEVRRHVFLAVKDGVITAIGPAADLPRDDGAEIDDLSHCTILPPLVDCSVSLLRSPSVDRTVREELATADPDAKAEVLKRHLQDCHAHGVLGVADSGDPIGPAADYQEEMIAIRTSGGCRLGNPDCGADGDYLKIAYSAGIEDDDALPPRPDYKELCRILQGKGKKKAVVMANGPQAVAEALLAGCDAIEQGYGMGEDNLRKMAENNVLWIPSVIRARNGLDSASSGGDVCCRFSTRYVAPGKVIPGAEAYWKKMLAGQLAQLRLAGKLGVTLAVGTGAGSIGILHGEAMVEEMKLFIKGGFSLPETIRCASANGARFFGMEGLGELNVGRQATFLVSRGAPKQLPRKLAYLEGIYIDGAPSKSYRKNPVRTA